MPITSAELNHFIAGFFWPLVRIGAMVGIAPVLGANMVPMRVRLGVTLALTLLIMPVVPPIAPIEPFSLRGVLVIAQQLVIGVAMGFALRLVFESLTLAGQTIATSMGLGLASTIDSQNGVQVPVVSQFYIILMTLVFLGVNGHLVLIEMLAKSFTTMPVAVDGLTRNGLWQLVGWGGEMFAGAVLIALPVVASVLLLNISLGVITRAAPQLNIFAVGFPLTILIGFTIVWVALPSIVPHFEQMTRDGFVLIGRLLNFPG